MNENTREIFRRLENTYSTVPGLDCGSCWGECCVSPTLTAPEFIYMMVQGLQIYDPLALAEFICSPVKEHRFYHGNQHCRFQHPENGRCQNYAGRALACRLHGHEILRIYSTEENEFCDKKPGGNHALTEAPFNKMLETIRELCAAAGSFYEEPYYLVSLNLEAWLDFYYLPQISDTRPVLKSLRDYIIAQVSLPEIPFYKAHTTLEGKLKSVDRLYYYIDHGNIEFIEKELDALIFDFPTAGSYYIDEARQMKKIVNEKKKEAPGHPGA